MTKSDERTLVLKFVEAKKLKEETALAAEEASKKFSEIEIALVETMEDMNLEATARYEGIGYCKLMKPRLYASYKKENEEDLFGYLKKEGREDLIKPSVHAASLSGFVSELVEAGKPIPEAISFYMKKSIRLY